MIGSTMTNTASMISGNSNNSSTSAIPQGLAGALANGNSSVNNSFNNSIAAALSNSKSDDLNTDRLQAFLKAQSLFNSSNNGLDQSNNSSNNNPMLELMANQNNSQTQQQIMDLLFKSQTSLNTQNGNQQQNQNLNEQDFSQMSDELDSSKDRSMTPLDSIYKKMSNGEASQNDSMHDIERLYQEHLAKIFAAQMENNLKQQQSQQSKNSVNNNANDKNDEFRQACAIYQHELAKLNSSGQPSIEILNRLQNAANLMNQAQSNQERLLLRENNLSRDSNSSLNDESKCQNSRSNNDNLKNNNQQSSNSAFPMVKSFLNSSNNGSNSSNLAKNEDSCSSGKSTPVNSSLNNTNNGQPEDLSVVSSPLQRIQSITNSLLTQPHPIPSTSPNRAFNAANNAAANQSKAILPPITQHQFDLYNNLNTEEIVKKVKEQLSQYSISQRLFGESGKLI